jgi:hypothetical protein
MNKKKSFVLIAVVVLGVAAIVWFGSGPLWRWLLAMHGRH